MTRQAENMNSGFVVYLHSEDLISAQKAALQHNSSNLRREIYLNTMSVNAVNRSLKPTTIETDLSKSYSNNPGAQALFGSRDLYIQMFGKIECIPVMPGEKVIQINEPIDSDTNAYVAVQFQEKLSQVKIAGYILSEGLGHSETVELSKLKPYAQLIYYLVNKTATKSDIAFSEQSNIIDFWDFANKVKNENELSAKTAFVKESSSNISIEEDSEFRTVLFKDEDFPVSARLSISPLGDKKYELVVEIYPYHSDDVFPAGVELSVFQNSQIQYQYKTEEEEDNIYSDSIILKASDILGYLVDLGQGSAKKISGSLKLVELLEKKQNMFPEEINE